MQPHNNEARGPPRLGRVPGCAGRPRVGHFPLPRRTVRPGFLRPAEPGPAGKPPLGRTKVRKLGDLRSSGFQHRPPNNHGGMELGVPPEGGGLDNPRPRVPGIPRSENLRS